MDSIIESYNVYRLYKNVLRFSGATISNHTVDDFDLFHSWSFATGQHLMAVGTPTPGDVSGAAAATLPHAR